MSEFEDLERMLRLKRYEKPPEDYYDRFFSEFQARQRSEMLRQSAHGLFFERVSVWMYGLGNRRWLYAGGVAYAAVMIVVFLTPLSDKLNPSNGGKAALERAEIPETGNKESQAIDDNEDGQQGEIREL